MSGVQGHPVGPMRTYRVTEVIRHSKSYVSFRLPVPMVAQPGQFVMLWLPGAEEKPFTLSDCHNGMVEITVRAVGPFTNKLMGVRAGDRLGIRGPFGHGFSLMDKAFVVGGGCGVAPVRHLLKALERGGLSFAARLAARTGDELIFRSEYDAASWCSLSTDDGSLGQRGLVTEGLEDAIRAYAPSRVYACGPELMMDAVKLTAGRLDLGVELAMERYMKCGVGICGSCMCAGTHKRVCVDGPVFSVAVVKSFNTCF